MNDRKDRSNRLSRRLNDEPNSDESSPGENEQTTQSQNDTPSKPSVSSNPSKTAKTGVKNRTGVLMYLPDDLSRELDARFDELNAQYKREHGEKLEKNRDWYVAVIKAGLTGKDVEDILDI